MKMTNHTLIRLVNELSFFVDKKLPQKISYAITRNIMLATTEYQIYEAQLKKIIESYSDNMLKDSDGNVKVSTNGLPMVDKSVSQEFYDTIADLLNIEIELDIYTIDESAFDYDDNGKYDVLTANNIILLQSILCSHEDTKNKKSEGDE